MGAIIKCKSSYELSKAAIRQMIQAKKVVVKIKAAKVPKVKPPMAVKHRFQCPTSYST